MPSGIFGLVEDATGALSTVESWTLNDTKSSDSYSASNTLNGVVRGGGIRTWDGSFIGKGAEPPIMPGESFTFKGYTEPTSGTEGETGITYEGPAICSQVTAVWNWATNTILAWTVTFSGNPGLTIATAVPTLDASIPTVGATCGTKVEYALSTAPTVFIEIPAVTQATLSISSTLASEANSSTFANGECWMGHSKGPIDWTLALPQEDYQRGVDGYPLIGGYNLLKLYVDGTDFWELRFSKTESYTGLIVDRNGGTTIARTINFAMSATDGVTMGLIKKPSEELTGPVYWGKPDTP